MSMIGNFLQVTPDQLQALIADPTKVADALFPECVNCGALDVDKTWQAIHFLLTGDPWGGESPVADAVLGGGIEIGDDVGYGPARYLTAAEVAATANALRLITKNELALRFDPATLSENEIYPEIWDEGNEAMDYVLVYFDQLRTYYLDAAAKGNAMLKYIN